MAESFASLLDAAARRQPQKPALVWKGGALTAQELDLRAGGMARRLSRRGARPGDTIAVSLPNGWPFAVAVLGGLKLGAMVTPLNPLLGDEERERVLAHLEPTLVIDEVRAEEAVWDSASGSGAAFILYTSGSTGQPKGAVLSHRALRAANEAWVGPIMRLTAADVVLAALPLAHSYGLNGALLAPLLAGATVIVMDRFAPEDALEAIARHRVTVFPGVATMFRRLLDSPALGAADLSSLRLVVAGAAPCPWELAEEWKKRTGVRILRGYGSTELFRPISYLADDARDLPESIGRAVPGVELRVVDPEGRPRGPGETGELWIRTPAVMDGYLRAPEETAAVLSDGWFKTGDLAAVSPEGFVSIVGRKKELILRGGYSVMPGEVEAALLSHPAIAEAAVVGVHHPELGEEVAAFVTLRAGAQASPDEIISHCKERLTTFKYPRQVSIVAQLPKSATGKILKSQLTGKK